MIESMCKVNIAKKDNYSAPEMYVLTNAVAYYGAAGILNRELLQEFAGGRDFFILPSSIHDSATRFAA